MVKCIEADCPEEAWLRACLLLLNEGKKNGNNIELENLLVVYSPLNQNPNLQQLYVSKLGTEYLARVEKLIFSTKSLKWKCSYRSRLVSWNNEFDQLSEVIALMKKKPGAKTLTCVVTNPPKDLKRVWAIAASMPCLTAMDFRIRNNFLNLTIYFRSQDIFRIGFPDYFYLGKFFDEIYEQMLINSRFNRDNLHKGKITCHIVSAFIRCKDLGAVRKLI